MGFGSYDESEQENQTVSTDFDDDDSVQTDETNHEGDIEFEFTTTNDELLDQLQEMKEDV